MRLSLNTDIWNDTNVEYWKHRLDTMAMIAIFLAIGLIIMSVSVKAIAGVAYAILFGTPALIVTVSKTIYTRRATKRVTEKPAAAETSHVPPTLK